MCSTSRASNRSRRCRSRSVIQRQNVPISYSFCLSGAIARVWGSLRVTPARSCLLSSKPQTGTTGRFCPILRGFGGKMRVPRSTAREVPCARSHTAPHGPAAANPRMFAAIRCGACGPGESNARACARLCAFAACQPRAAPLPVCLPRAVLTHLTQAPVPAYAAPHALYLAASSPIPPCSTPMLVAPVSPTHRTSWGSHVFLSAVLGLFLIYL